MQPRTSFFANGSRSRTKRQSGVALIVALLLLLLLSGLSVVMVLSTNSDLLTNGYYRGFRGAFYAADSGLNVVRQDMVNQILLAKNANFSITQQAIPPSAAASVQNYISNNYAQAFRGVSGAQGQGQASGSWPESFEVTAVYFGVDPTTGQPNWSCQPIGGAGTCASPTGPVTGYQYSYPYTVTAQGRAQGTEKATVTDSGILNVKATLNPNASTTSFAAWGMFIDQFPICSGSTLVPGTITGPVFTNGAWTFGTSGQYIFTDSVGSVSTNSGFQFSDKCDQVAGASDSEKNGKTTTTIAPAFQSGLNLAQAKIPLPSNDYNQEQAVLDGKGNASGAATNSALHNSLMNINRAAYPSSSASTGVYLPYTIQNGVPTFTGGGIYVQGNANVTLSTSRTSGQVYSITQGSTTTTITVNPTTNTTTMVSGGTTLNISGVPEQIDPATNAVVGPATMLYVDGSITALSGPGQGQAAIQDGSALTITAASNVTITGDILYKTEPVTLTQNQIPNTPSDTLIPGNNNGQTLGIFTANGDIQLANKQSNGNLQIDGSLATICATGTGGCNGNGGLVNTGNAINTLTIVGGRIQNQIKNINTTSRNVFFDRRYTQGGFSPPWFPSTSVGLGSVTGGTVTAAAQRIQWVNQTPYF
jgi:Tfp pilus assembly protein PilX